MTALIPPLRSVCISFLHHSVFCDKYLGQQLVKSIYSHSFISNPMTTPALPQVYFHSYDRNQCDTLSLNNLTIASKYTGFAFKATHTPGCNFIVDGKLSVLAHRRCFNNEDNLKGKTLQETHLRTLCRQYISNSLGNYQRDEYGYTITLPGIIIESRIRDYRVSSYSNRIQRTTATLNVQSQIDVSGKQEKYGIFDIKYKDRPLSKDERGRGSDGDKSQGISAWHTNRAQWINSRKYGDPSVLSINEQGEGIPADVKCFVFNGKTQIITHVRNRFDVMIKTDTFYRRRISSKENDEEMEFDLIPGLSYSNSKSGCELIAPSSSSQAAYLECIDDILSAKVLQKAALTCETLVPSDKFNFIRVDLLLSHSKESDNEPRLTFGEYTVYPKGGDSSYTWKHLPRRIAVEIQEERDRDDSFNPTKEYGMSKAMLRKTQREKAEKEKKNEDNMYDFDQLLGSYWVEKEKDSLTETIRAEIAREMGKRAMNERKVLDCFTRYSVSCWH